MNIRDQIVATRRGRIAREGHELGHPVPHSRAVPIVPFGRRPFLICEIKRKSPSRGAIAADLDPVEQASRYQSAGVRSISVLTEEDHFGGALADIMAVKSAFPDIAVLRKDFLVDDADIWISHRAGADAVLLIASLFSPEEFAALYSRTVELGMRALVEIHDDADLEIVRPVRPDLVGINSRDLRTFRVDRLHPARLRTLIDWDAEVVFESGIWHEEDVLYARSTGFSGVLVGESVTRNPRLIPYLIEGFQAPAPTGRFWQAIAEKLDRRLPLVKICGLCTEADARLSAELGADILGFVFADSPRRTDAATVRAVRELPVPKVAVVVADTRASNVPRDVEELLADGSLDAIQFHGDEEPGACYQGRYPYYKAIRLRNAASVDAIETYRSPRVLVDAYDPGARGGTGRTVAAELVARAKAKHPLWLAGGLTPESVRRHVEDLRPELIDVSSGVEAGPGRKDPGKLKRYFREVSHAAH